MDSSKQAKLTAVLQEPIINHQIMTGGCIAESYCVTTKTQQYFAKFSNHTLDLNKEAHGLYALAATEVINTPKIIYNDNDLLILTYIETQPATAQAYQDLAKQLANLHKQPQEYFGFTEDNYIGSTPQINTPSNDWITFFSEQRLGYQLKLSQQNKLATTELINGIVQLQQKLPEILANSSEPPALLHGDLWSGNFIVDRTQQAYLIDPAVYYGHREADLAMTKLCGSFPDIFYKTYDKYYPLKPGYQQREKVYLLYHLLNHLNLFGNSYYAPTVNCLSECFTDS